MLNRRTAEIRGEDASEVLSMLKGRRVLLEPASMELRFSNEVLKPRVELDRARPWGTFSLPVIFTFANA
jgi:hypothetical protein